MFIDNMSQFTDNDKTTAESKVLTRRQLWFSVFYGEVDDGHYERWMRSGRLFWSGITRGDFVVDTNVSMTSELVRLHYCK